MLKELGFIQLYSVEYEYLMEFMKVERQLGI